MGNKRTISITVTDFEYDEILMYARIKGHGGQYPASVFAHYAVFQQMKKYPLKEAEISKYIKNTAIPKTALRLYSPRSHEEIRKGLDGGNDHKYKGV